MTLRPFLRLSPWIALVAVLGTTGCASMRLAGQRRDYFLKEPGAAARVEGGAPKGG